MTEADEAFLNELRALSKGMISGQNFDKNYLSTMVARADEFRGRNAGMLWRRARWCALATFFAVLALIVAAFSLLVSRAA